MRLENALEEAKPGDRILLASWGNGGDAMVLKRAHQMENMKADKKGSVTSFSHDFPGVVWIRRRKARSLRIKKGGEYPYGRAED